MDDYRTPPPTTIKSKDVCFTDTDWRLFGDALQEMFPQARYVGDLAFEERKDHSREPTIRVARHLCAVPRVHHDYIYMTFDPFWEPSCYKRYTGIKGHPDYELNWRWSRMPPPHPMVMFSMWNMFMNRHMKADLGMGQIHFYSTPKDKAHESLRGKFYRLFAKHATNRGLYLVSLDDGRAGPDIEKGFDVWCGHDAIRWARTSPTHYLKTFAGWGLRPFGAAGDVIPFRKPQTAT